MSKSKRYPKQLKCYSDGEVQDWELIDGLVAKLNVEDQEPIENEVVRFDASTVVCKIPGYPDDAVESDNDAPMYKAGTDGSPGVATGLIFVRPREGIELEDCRESLEGVGFKIEQQSPTGGGWVRHQTDSIKAGLLSYPDILEIDEIRTVEPQFLMKRHSKSLRRSNKPDDKS